MSRALDNTLAADADLLADFRQTRAQATFAQLVARHQPMVYRTCFRLLGNQQDAEDAAQSTFLVLSRNAGRIDRLLTPWLHKVARNLSIQLLRSRVRRQKREQVVARSEAAAELSPANLAEELDHALNKLPADQREAVILRYLEGRSQDEAAALVGCPRGTLSQRASRGLERLRDILSRRGVLGSAALAAWLQQEATASAACSAASSQLAAAVLEGSAGSQAACLADAFGKLAFWTKVKTAGLVAGTVTLTTAVIVAVSLPAPTELHGHAGPVKAVACSPDGAVLASADSSGQVIVWDGHSRSKLRSFETGHAMTSLSAAGRLVAASGTAGPSADDPRAHNQLFIWNVDSGAVVLDKPVAQRVYGIALSPDGKFAATSGVGQNVPDVFDLATGNQRRLVGPRGIGWGNTVVFAPDGKRLYFGGWEQGARGRASLIAWWDTTTWNLGGTFGAEHLSDVGCIALSSDGTRLVGVDASGNTGIWDVTASPPRLLERATGAYTGRGLATVTFLDTASQLAWIGVHEGGKTRLLVGSPGAMQVLEAPTLPDPIAVAYSREKRLLAVGTRAGPVQLIPLDDLMKN